MIFPTVIGQNLQGKAFSFPHGLEGEFNLLVLAFHPSQQIQVQSWAPSLRSLCAQYATLHHYEVPVLADYDHQSRVFITMSMRQQITDPAQRHMVIVLYLDKAAFLKQLNLPDQNSVYTLLVEREGQVLWQEQGFHTSPKSDRLRAHLDALYTPIDLSLWQ